MKVKGYAIRTQKLKEIAGTSGAYERWVDGHKGPRSRGSHKGDLGDKFDFVHEDVRANPDSLREDERLYADSQLTRPQELMGEAIEHLQGRQKQVYLLTYRRGLSIREAARRLKISKSTAETFRNRAARFITGYCESAIQRGDLNG